MAWQPALNSNLSSAPGAKASRRSAALENGKETYTIELAEGSGAFEVVGQDVEHTRFTVTKLVPGSRFFFFEDAPCVSCIGYGWNVLEYNRCTTAVWYV